MLFIPIVFLSLECVCVFVLVCQKVLAVMDEGEGSTVFMLKLIIILSVNLVDPVPAFTFWSPLLHLLISIFHSFNAFCILNDLIFIPSFSFFVMLWLFVRLPFIFVASLFYLSVPLKLSASVSHSLNLPRLFFCGLAVNDP